MKFIIPTTLGMGSFPIEFRDANLNLGADRVTKFNEFQRGTVVRSDDMPNWEISRSRLEGRLILRAWEDEEFRRALLQDPRALVARELAAMAGRQIELPADLQIHIHEETPTDVHFILPDRRDELPEDGQSMLVGWGKLLG